MIYSFKLTDGDIQYVVDTESLTWARASSIISAPSIDAAKNNFANFVPQEEGRLIPLGSGRFALDGRKPFDAEGHPQFAIFVILTVLSSDQEGTCFTALQANVATKDFQHQQIKNFHAHCMPPLQLTPRDVGKIHAVDAKA